MTELVHVDPTAGALSTRADLRNAATDSWTDVLVQVGHLAERIAGTDFVPKAMRDNVPAVAAVILHGREVGFGPMTALAQTHVIDGRVAISSEAMRALIMQHGHEIRVDAISGSVATVSGRRRGEEHWLTISWTIDDARRADLTTKTNWKRYPRQMLLARASAELARAKFADVIHGLMSTEELDELVTAPSEPQTAISGPEAPRTTQVSRKRAKARQNETSAVQDPPTGPTADGDGVDAPPTVDPVPTPDIPAADIPADIPAGVAPHSRSENAQSADVVPDQEPVTKAYETEIEAHQREIRELSEQVRSPSSAPAEPDEVDPYATVNAPLTPPATPVENIGAPVTGMQRGKIMAELSRIGVATGDDNRDMRLTYLAALAGRAALASTNDLTFREAHQVINRLLTVTDLADLETKLSAL